MTLDEMKLAVCEKLPELLVILDTVLLVDDKIVSRTIDAIRWRDNNKEIHWPTEGLQVCHEAEKLFTVNQIEDYWEILSDVAARDFPDKHYGWFLCLPHEQRLEALCRVWFPEKFKV